jgi:hypothetical protein
VLGCTVAGGMGGRGDRGHGGDAGCGGVAGRVRSRAGPVGMSRAGGAARGSGAEDEALDDRGKLKRRVALKAVAGLLYMNDLSGGQAVP